MTKNERRILNDSIKFKMNTLAEITGKNNSEALNYALDVAIAFERTKFDLIKLKTAIQIAKEYLNSLKWLIKKTRKLL